MICILSAYPVNVEDVHVVRTQFLERGGDGQMKGLHVIPNITSLLRDAAGPLVIGAILSTQYQRPEIPFRHTADRTHLCCNNHLVANAALLHPLTDELFGRLVLVDVCRIDEVPARLVERVQQLEAACLVHYAEADLVPLVPDAHRPKAQRRHVYAREGSELAVPTQPRLRRWRLDEETGAGHAGSVVAA